MDGPKMTFCIPKVKRSQAEGCRTLVSPSSRDYKETLETIKSSFLDSNYCFSKNWNISSVEQVTNKKLQKSFQEKRQELRSKLNCYDVGERFAFTIVDSEEKVHDACQNGLFSGHETLSSATLGKRSDGVHVWLYADIALRLTSIEWTTIHLIVYKIMRGRVKFVNPGVEVEPTPNYESHISRNVPHAKAQFDQIVKNAQIYIYEYDKECCPSNQPRHCYPYSVVTFTKPAHSITGNEHILEASTTTSDTINSTISVNLSEKSNQNANKRLPCEKTSGRLQPIIVRSEQEDKLLRLKQKLLKNQKAVEYLRINKKNAEIQQKHDSTHTNCHAKTDVSSPFNTKNLKDKEERKLHSLSLKKVDANNLKPDVTVKSGLSKNTKENHLFVVAKCTKMLESNKTKNVSKETRKQLTKSQNLPQIKKKMSSCKMHLKEDECLVNKPGSAGKQEVMSKLSTNLGKETSDKKISGAGTIKITNSTKKADFGHELKSKVWQQDQTATTSNYSKCQVKVKSLDSLSSDFIKNLQDKNNEHVNQLFQKGTNEEHDDMLKEGANNVTSLDSLKDYLPKSKSMIPTNSSKTTFTEAMNESPVVKHSLVLVQFTRKWLIKCGWKVGNMVGDNWCLNQNCKRILEWIEVMAVRYRDKGMHYFNLGILDCRVLRYYIYLQENEKSCQTQELINEDIGKNELESLLMNLLVLYTVEEMPKELIDIVAKLKLGNSGVALKKVGKLAKTLKCNEGQMAQHRLNKDDGEDSTDSGAGLSTIFSDDDNQPNQTLDKTKHNKSTGTYNDHSDTFITEDIIMKIYKRLQDEMEGRKKTISLNIYNICSGCGMQKNQSIIIENVLDSDSNSENISAAGNMMDKKHADNITKTARKSLHSDQSSICGITNHMKQTACHSQGLYSTTDENLTTSKTQTKDDKGILPIRNANHSSRCIAPKDHKILIYHDDNISLERNIGDGCISNTRPLVTTLYEKTSNLSTDIPLSIVHCDTESIIKSSTVKEIQNYSKSSNFVSLSKEWNPEIRLSQVSLPMMSMVSDGISSKKISSSPNNHQISHEYDIPLPEKNTHTSKEQKKIEKPNTTVNKRENDMSVPKKNTNTHSNFVGGNSSGNSTHVVSLQKSTKLVDVDIENYSNSNTKDFNNNYCYAKSKTRESAKLIVKNDNSQQVKDNKLCSNKPLSKDNRAAKSDWTKDGDDGPRKRRSDDVLATSSLKRSKTFLLPTPSTKNSERTQGKIKSSTYGRTLSCQESKYKFREGYDHIKKTSSSDYKHMNKARLHQESRLDPRIQ